MCLFCMVVCFDVCFSVANGSLVAKNILLKRLIMQEYYRSHRRMPFIMFSVYLFFFVADSALRWTASSTSSKYCQILQRRGGTLVESTASLGIFPKALAQCRKRLSCGETMAEGLLVDSRVFTGVGISDHIGSSL